MKKTINLIETNLTNAEWEKIKNEITSKITQLPNNDAAAATLQELEEILALLGGGGRAAQIKFELESISNPTVKLNQRLISQHISSIQMTLEQRTELFKLWRDDELVNCDKLLTKGKKTIADVITGYQSNPAIRELTDELMRQQAIGQGKGEFGLCALSKKITKQRGKGDLNINGHHVELKTTDLAGGRFTDTDVRPGAGFEQAANALRDYITVELGMPLVISGLTIAESVKIINLLNSPETAPQKKKFIELCRKTISLVFDNTDSAAVDRIISAISSGNAKIALQEYAKLNFNYYIGKKKDDGVLYINLAKNPFSFVYFTSANELATYGLRLHARAPYFTNTTDNRYPYPQMDIVDTSAGTQPMAPTPVEAQPMAPISAIPSSPPRGKRAGIDDNTRNKR